MVSRNIWRLHVPMHLPKCNWSNNWETQFQRGLLRLCLVVFGVALAAQHGTGQGGSSYTLQAYLTKRNQEQLKTYSISHQIHLPIMSWPSGNPFCSMRPSAQARMIYCPTTSRGGDTVLWGMRFWEDTMMVKSSTNSCNGFWTGEKLSSANVILKEVC